MTRIAALAIVLAIFFGGWYYFTNSSQKNDAGSREKKEIIAYTVSLDWINLSKFSTGFLGDANPDLFIKTIVQAEGISGVQESIFSKVGAWPAGWDDVPPGSKVGISGKDSRPAIIYKGFGCASEPVKQFVVTVNLADMDSELPAALKTFLDTTATGFGGILGTGATTLTDSIGAELKKMGQFPQISGTIKATGTTTLSSIEDNGRQFDATLTVESTKQSGECNAEAIAKLRAGK